MLAERERGGFGDERLVVGEQREQRRVRDAARPSVGRELGRAAADVRVGDRARPRRHAARAIAARRGVHERAERDRADAGVGIGLRRAARARGVRRR